MPPQTDGKNDPLTILCYLCSRWLRHKPEQGESAKSGFELINRKTLEQQEDTRSRWKKWLVRFGWAGFLFFLIKGLIWLAAGYWIFNETTK